MSNSIVFVVLISFLNGVLLQGSGSNGNLRVCIVEGRGSYKRGSKYCPILDEEKANVECVLGFDRLDCIRRISKGSVDFGVFSPEDLIAAQWAGVNVLVTNELRLRNRPFSRRIVALVNRRILPDEASSISTILKSRTLCYPAVDYDDLRPLSDTLARYLESLVTVRSCDPDLSLEENRLKATAEFFRQACKAGQWVPDRVRDEQLKRKYPSLCAACASKTCSTNDVYWGDSGALNCMAENAGDVTWAELDDVTTYFKSNASVGRFAFLCRDGTWQSLDTPQPCFWLQRPWPVIVSKRTVAAQVSQLTTVLSNPTVTVSGHWQGALAALLEIHQSPPLPLQPPLHPMDFLARAMGFREAYSQHGCDPPRHISLCTTSLLENNKCEWLSEAGAVYGIAPPLQCSWLNSTEDCLKAIRDGRSDVTVATSDWLVAGMRDYSVKPILHEATPIIDKSNTVVAYVRKDAGITTMAELRGKRAAFPRFDGLAFHSVLRYTMDKKLTSCSYTMSDYFKEICAPGIERYNASDDVIAKFTSSCYKEDGKILQGEFQALRSLVEGKNDVAFISMDTFNLYTALALIPEPWTNTTVDLTPVCPAESGKYCFVSWSNIGHIFAKQNLTTMRRYEIINVFTKLDQLFGKKHVNSVMFSLYGPYNHQKDVIFHNNTRTLISDNTFSMHPYSDVPLIFDRNLTSCQIADMLRGVAVRIVPTILPLLLLVSIVITIS